MDSKLVLNLIQEFMAYVPREQFQGSNLEYESRMEEYALMEGNTRLFPVESILTHGLNG